ncbi:putative GTD-binding domain-containing protein [Lupinus albus]|uniref:Putative GTD-binding domain-containing protein n=1 Tax=Lupinus albus TaxID=3870 RepID=A0A6A4NCQ8_LUPAL|nr:putative GTD-binding domain-containing protein [Lupinus albus]
MIIFLLLNSLFSYLIIKYADFFGLKRPCIWCTRIDHIIEPEKNKNPCRDIVCEAHATEISMLCFCSKHLKLVESQHMCEDCSSLSSQQGYVMNQIGMNMIKDDDDDDNEPLKCSCCGVNLVKRFYPPCFLIKPSSRNILEYPLKQNLITESGVSAEIDEGGDESDHSRSGFVLDHHGDKHGNEENSGINMVFEVDHGRDKSFGCSVCDGVKKTLDDEIYKLDLGVEKGKENMKDETFMDNDDEPCEKNTAQVDCNGEMIQEIPNIHLEFFIHGDDCRLVPVELVESSATETVESIQLRNREKSSEFEGEEENLQQNYHDLRFSQTGEELHKVDNVQANMEKGGELCFDFSLCLSEDATQMQGDEFEAEVSIGTEIPDQDQVDEYQCQDTLLDTNQKIQDLSTSTVNFHVQYDCGQDKSEDFLEFKTMPLEVRMATMNNHLTSTSLELHENEEEKVPDTPTSVEKSGTEDSFDGSVTSDLECGEVTIEKLKSALKCERKALSTLYAELEEERNASAISANQTMAMINRLQEEKASMQMEALQYQRMMDEQSEYDQEALQILNELMIKTEKEKQNLEKELEIYRKKVHEYEVREKMIMSRRDGSSIRSMNSSSPSCSNAEESDELSIDLNHKSNDFYSPEECSNQNTPANAVMYLKESLENFEEERLSILERIKVLEEKLVILNYEDEQQYHDVKLIENLREENGNGYHDHGNGYANGLNGKHHEGRNIIGAKGKRLLPLFNAISIEEAEDMELSGDENELEFSSLQNGSYEKFHLDKEKVALEEEMGHVYEKLQVLEADREFLKHCFRSLRKGDKGLDLLQEILQHLRDLRNVELRARNMGYLAV